VLAGGDLAEEGDADPVDRGVLRHRDGLHHRHRAAAQPGVRVTAGRSTPPQVRAVMGCRPRARASSSPVPDSRQVASRRRSISRTGSLVRAGNGSAQIRTRTYAVVASSYMLLVAA